MTMKVIHFTALRNLSGGQRKQLQQERIAASTLPSIQWDTFAIHDGIPRLDFERRTPLLFRAHLLRSLYAWHVAYRLSLKCDLLLMRHAPFDIVGPLFSKFIKNRVSVHHSREIEELPLIRSGLLGKFLSAVERIFGSATIRNTRAVLGVTREISEYEVRRARCPDKPRNIYPNTIVTRHVEILADEREDSRVHAAFICGRFTSWHGLDLLLEDARNAPEDCAGKLCIHLIGNLSDSQKEALSRIEPGVFDVHGHLSEDQYRRIISRCDVGVGSLALERQLMSEGSTLKMCEMLALGLPVYSGNPDVVLPMDFRFCEVDSRPSLSGLHEFGLKMKRVSRLEVRSAAEPYIEKEDWMAQAAKFLQGVWQTST